MKLDIGVASIALAWFVVIGCGGTTAQTSSINGIVTDLQGKPVRGATVTGCGVTTTTNSIGVYNLDAVCVGEATVFATLTQDGVSYKGTNSGLTFDNEVTKNVNIEMGRVDQFSTVKGTVYDPSGNPVGFARVFCTSKDGLSSVFTTASSTGVYSFGELINGVTYTIRPSIQDFNNDQVDVTLGAKQTQTVDLFLHDALNPALQPPTGLTATAWTSPYVANRSAGHNQADAMESIKRLMEPARASKHVVRSSATARGSSFIEVDLSFTGVQSVSLYGYGVYRQSSPTAAPFVNLLRDPGANYYVDLDASLQVGATYTYWLTSLTTSDPNARGSESAYSSTSSATPLGSIDSAFASGNPAQITWSAVTGAANYTVFVYNEYPGIGVSPVWDNSANPATGTTVTVTPSLAPGTYYFVVVGQTADGSAKTISDIKSFTQ